MTERGDELRRKVGLAMKAASDPERMDFNDEITAAIRAVLDALAEPSEGMAKAAMDDGSWKQLVLDHWGAMIAAARKELLGDE